MEIRESIGSVLRELRVTQGYLQQEVSDRLTQMGCKITKASVSRWENGYTNPTITQFIALCEIYNVKNVYSVFMRHDLSQLEHTLNREGRQKLAEYKELLVRSNMFSPVSLAGPYALSVGAEATENYGRAILRPKRTRPLYDESASAGTGQFLDNDSYEEVEIDDSIPDSASFGLRVNGNSMEPKLHDGQIIWVHQQAAVENGEIGIFFVDGNVFVKELMITPKGSFMKSLNPDYEPIALSEYNNVKVYGRVVYPE